MLMCALFQNTGYVTDFFIITTLDFNLTPVYLNLASYCMTIVYWFAAFQLDFCGEIQ